jgi:type IV secretory pathway VirB4 component
VIIIDEAGINANSKDTFSAESRILQEVLFLARKKNCSVIWIAQRLRSIDINARELADGIFKTYKIRRSN